MNTQLNLFAQFAAMSLADTIAEMEADAINHIHKHWRYANAMTVVEDVDDTDPVLYQKSSRVRRDVRNVKATLFVQANVAFGIVVIIANLIGMVG